MSFPCAVFPEEVDYCVGSLRCFQVADIGSKSWFDQYEITLKLTQQAYIEASTKQEEVIKERIIIDSKLPTLVHEVFCISIWKGKVLPKLLQGKSLDASFVLYSVLYYEVNLVALLETILFHRNSCEALGECTLDLIDYSTKSVGFLIGIVNQERLQNTVAAENLHESVQEEIERLKRDIDFRIGLKCLTILNYLVDNLETLPLSAVNLLIKTHDTPCLLSEILHVKPWLRKRKGFEQFLNDRWEPVYGGEIFKVTKSEAQAWFCLFGLLFNKNVMADYEINEFRQREIGKCIGLLNEQLLDQLPALVQLKQHLCSFQMKAGSSGRNRVNLLLEELPEISNSIWNTANKYGWRKIIENHKQIFINISSQELSEMAKRLSTAYNTDLLEKYSSTEQSDLHTYCSTCKKTAEKKCSKCESVFYCSRDCQVKDWPQHKELCHQLKAL
ncbi:zinc finger MYND domain-containing protein 10 homolog [Topomyia yanbarensis]|uniref:zinc finger MYND domain-containing protein 10 homolog n=1 Tax=Topomyia yanbarensis TaxID=2498891 RepID=UPI00273AD5D4|nr:zinc finger MYND domain-containing protein 10 homolog [Topomyia yanbarensis]